MALIVARRKASEVAHSSYSAASNQHPDETRALAFYAEEELRLFLSKTEEKNPNPKQKLQPKHQRGKWEKERRKGEERAEAFPVEES